MVNLADNFLSSPLPGVAAVAPIRAGGIPLGKPLCGYHTPSSGCSGLKERGGGGGQCQQHVLDLS